MFNVTRAQIAGVKSVKLIQGCDPLPSIQITFENSGVLTILCQMHHDLEIEYGPTITTKPTLDRNELRKIASADLNAFLNRGDGTP